MARRHNRHPGPCLVACLKLMSAKRAIVPLTANLAPMTEIRIRSSGRFPHPPSHDYREWRPSGPAVRRDCEIIVETANELFGENTHWIEEREAAPAGRGWQSRFDAAWLRDMASTSAHARQLADGYRGARFDTTLEAEYAAYLKVAHRPNARVLVAFGMAGWVLLALADIFRLHEAVERPEVPYWVWTIATLRACELVLGLCCIGLIMTPSTTHRGAMVASVFLPVALAGGVTSSLYRLHGLPHADLLLLLPILATFFPMGLVFRQSMVIAFAMAILSTLPGFFLLPPDQRGGQAMFLFLLLLTASFASITGYLREMASREQFLTRGLLRQQVMLDPLTGLQNRRWLSNHFELVRSRADQENRAISFLLINVDHLKDYNDAQGHLAGDAALVAIAEVIAGFQRDALDVASRLGGDEFGLLLYGCSLQDALFHGERLRAQIAAAVAVDPVSGEPTMLSASLGIVQVQSGEPPQTFYRRAERLLFESKKAGGNRLTGAGDARVTSPRGA